MLSSNNAGLTVPASVTVVSGGKSANFTATAGTVSSSQSATVTAALNGSSETAAIVVTPITTVTSLACSPASVTSGGTSSCTATLSQAAGPGGSTVTLSSNNAAVTVPASLTVASGATTASFTATAGTVTSNQAATLTASLTGSSATATVTVTPVVTITTVQCSPATIPAGTKSTCTVTLSQAAPSGGTSVSLSDDNAALTVPASVTVSKGATSANFTAKTTAVTANTTATITATINADPTSASVVITPYTVTSLQCSPTTIPSGASTNCTAALSQAAPSGSPEVKLTYGTTLLSGPSGVTPAANATSISFTAAAKTVSANKVATITAKLNGSSAAASVTLQPSGAASKPATHLSSGGSTGSSSPQSAPLSLSCAPAVLAAGGNATCEMRISPAGTAQVQIATDSAQVKAPSTIAVRTNQTSLSFEVTSDAAARHQFATVTASAGGAAAKDTIEITAAARPILTVPNAATGRPGRPVHFRVTAETATNQPVQLRATGVPPGATFDAASGAFEWMPVQVGKYSFSFTADAADGSSSSATVSINVGSGIPTVESLNRSCTPGGIGSVKGAWLSDPEQTGGTKALVNGQYVPVVEASDSGVEFLCPRVQAGAALQIAVETPSGVSNAWSTVMQSAAPWILTANGPAARQGQVTLAGSAELATVRNAFAAGHPAQAGDSVIVWATGLGDLSAGPGNMVSASVGGASADVHAVNSVDGRPGVYTVEVTIPEGVATGNAVAMQLQVTDLNGKLYNSNRVTIAVERNNQ